MEMYPIYERVHIFTIYNKLFLTEALHFAIDTNMPLLLIVNVIF